MAFPQRGDSGDVWLTPPQYPKTARGVRPRPLRRRSAPLGHRESPLHGAT